jgi:hypothetical protein
MSLPLPSDVYAILSEVKRIESSNLCAEPQSVLKHQHLRNDLALPEA